MTQAQALPQVRLRFAKRGDLRLVSHHDMMRCLERMVRRAKIPLATSQGFNPRPKIVFALALGLGIEAMREVVDLELTEPISPDEVRRRLDAVSIKGFDWLEARSLLPGESPPRPQSVSYLLSLPSERIEAAKSALAKFLGSSHWPYQRRRPNRTVSLDLRPFLIDAALRDCGALEFRVKVTSEGTARGEEIVEALGLSDLLERGTVLVRADIELSAPPLRNQFSPNREESAVKADSAPGNKTDSRLSIPTAISRPAGQAQAAANPARALSEFVTGSTESLGLQDGISPEDQFPPNTANRTVQKESA